MKKLKKLIGIPFSDFEEMIKPSSRNEEPQIYVRSAAITNKSTNTDLKVKRLI